MMRYVCTFLLFGFFLEHAGYFSRVPVSSLGGNDLAKNFDQLNGGQCPVIVWPSFSLEDSAANYDRRFYFLQASSWNTVLLWITSNLQTLNRDSARSVVQAISRELDTAKITLFLSHPDIEFLWELEKVGRLVATRLITFGILISMFTLFTRKIKTEEDSLKWFLPSRLIVVFYGVGENWTSNRDYHSVQENVFFFIWCIYLSTFQVVLAWWTSLFKALVNRMNEEWLKRYRPILSFSYSVFSVLTMLHILGILAYVVLSQAGFILPVYTIMLTSDVLRIMMTYLEHSTRSYNTLQNPQLSMPSWSISTVFIASDLFEFVFIISALYHGLFMKQRLVNLALSPYMFQVFNRLISQLFNLLLGVSS